MEEKKNKKNIIPLIISSLWFLLAAYMLIYRVILVGQYFNLIIVAFAIIIGFVTRKKRRISTHIVFIVLLAIGYNNFVGWLLFHDIERHDPLTKACYNIDIFHLEKSYGLNCSFFPDRLPKDAKNTHFNYMPTILQGDGHRNVFFETSEEYINQYLEEYSEQAILPAFTVSELYDQDNSIVLSNLEEYVEDSSDPVFHVTIPQYVRENYPNAKVYVIYSNFYWNHMYSRCFICDEESGLIGFTEGA